MSAPLYVREGSRFVPLPEVLLRDVPPIPVPVRDEAPDERPNWTAVPAPRCVHGHFARWAARNCCAPR
jgi:hypothetical protein